MTSKEEVRKLCIPKSELLSTSDEIPDGSKHLLKLNKKRVRSKSGVTYQIIRYDKDILNYSLYQDLGFFRSLILNLDDKSVCSVAPPKSLTRDQFIDQFNFSEIQVQEFVEGTMINVFWENTSSSWQIATRSSIGANVKFYQGKDRKTFKQMFDEALDVCGFDLNVLPKEYSYSFVLQHPDNRIVTPFSSIKLYLIDCYKIQSENDSVMITSYNIQNPNPNEIELKLREILTSDAKIHLPKIYSEYDNYKDYFEKYTSGDIPYEVVGIVFRHLNSSNRTKIRNPLYEEIRHLKGNHPKKQYRYLALRKSGKMSDYLKVFPEDKEDFSNFRNMCHKFTERLYTFYVGCYIKKQKELKYWPFEYRTHMMSLHKLYVYKLKPNNDYIRKHHVIEYFNLLHPSQQMFALNFKMRKVAIDTIKNDLDI